VAGVGPGLDLVSLSRWFPHVETVCVGRRVFRSYRERVLNRALLGSYRFTVAARGLHLDCLHEQACIVDVARRGHSRKLAGLGAHVAYVAYCIGHLLGNRVLS
jgi:hypothetical protein